MTKAWPGNAAGAPSVDGADRQDITTLQNLLPPLSEAAQAVLRLTFASWVVGGPSGSTCSKVRGTTSTAQDIHAVAGKHPDRAHTLNNQYDEAQWRYYLVIVRHVAATVPSTVAESTDELDESLREA